MGGVNRLLMMLTSVAIRWVPQRMEFNFDLWQEHLMDYIPSEDGMLSGDEIVDGLKYGFDIGLIENHPEPVWTHQPRIQLPFDVKLAITEWLVKGIKKGYILGPFIGGTCPIVNVICSPIFTVPKPPLPDGTPRYRPIQHLSHPKGDWALSINDLIDPKEKEVHYTSFYNVLQLVDDVGVNGYLWVVDAQDAYYRVPIKKKYWRYFGVEWCGYTFIFTSLQMGLGSACRIYTQFADAVEHIIRKSVGIDNVRLFWGRNSNRKLIWHYLDDFFGGSGNYNIAMQQFKLVVSWMERLGIPTAPDKVSPPNTVQKILGYLYNTKIIPTVSIPTEKINKVLREIDVMLRRKTATRKELECLVGLLMWISVVVFPGKAFVRRLEQVLHLETRRDGDKVKLKHYVLSDLRWWAVTLRSGLLVGVPIRWLLKQPDEAESK